MACAYVKVYYKGELIRTFGGNVREVRNTMKQYQGEDYKTIYHRNQRTGRRRGQTKDWYAHVHKWRKK